MKPLFTEMRKALCLRDISFPVREKTGEILNTIKDSSLKARFISISLLLITAIHAGFCDPHKDPAIQLNQIGFYPDQPKKAIVSGADTDVFYVVEYNEKDTVFSGSLSDPIASPFSGKTTRVADFSSLQTKGEFIVVVPGMDPSPSFKIDEEIYRPLADATLKAFYYQRVSTALLKKYAGKWARPAGHPDDEVYIHSSAASDQRPEGTVISSTRGWYDAGDYNKYIVNSGITMNTLMSLYEDHPDFFSDHNINIPESNNDIPDLLDEVLWNLRWMLTMQDPNDGGVYHKLTAANFEGMVMPEQATGKRYVVQKSTAAALDFAAVMAQAYRIYKPFETDLPGLSDSCLTAAENAWKWAMDNPKQLYNQNAMNNEFDPDVNTGAYGDWNVQDEFVWAAIELFISTNDDVYLDKVKEASSGRLTIPSWNSVKMLGYYALLRNEATLPDVASPIVQKIKSDLKIFADELISGKEDNPYQSVMGKSKDDFMWGSNSLAANQAVALLYAYNVFSDSRYLNGAMSNLDYLLGQNAPGYSFVTGYGHKTPMHPHHRPSEADGIAEPVPGFLVGGPNPGQQDGCDYPSDLPNESYTDQVCSYASNEIAINWNAPMVYLTYAIEIFNTNN